MNNVCENAAAPRTGISPKLPMTPKERAVRAATIFNAMNPDQFPGRPLFEGLVENAVKDALTDHGKHSMAESELKQQTDDLNRRVEEFAAEVRKFDSRIHEADRARLWVQFILVACDWEETTPEQAGWAADALLAEFDKRKVTDDKPTFGLPK